MKMVEVAEERPSLNQTFEELKFIITTIITILILASLNQTFEELKCQIIFSIAAITFKFESDL